MSLYVLLMSISWLLSLYDNDAALTEDYTLPEDFEVTFPPSPTGSNNMAMECAMVGIVDDNMFEGNEQTFTVNILSGITFLTSLAENVECTGTCDAMVTIQDNSPDCECVCVGV